MVFFIKEGDQYVKYSATFDEEKVRALRTKIIDDCSSILIETERGSDFPPVKDPLKIRNLRKVRSLGMQTNEDGEEVEFFEFRYLHYEFPPLVYLIDRLLEGDSTALDEIDAYSNKIERVDYDKEIQRLCSVIDSLDNVTDTYEKIGCLDVLDNLKFLASLNRNQLSDEAYLPMLKDLISITQIGTISVSEMDNVLSFLDSNYQSTIVGDVGQRTIYDANMIVKILTGSFAEMSKDKFVEAKDKPFVVAPIGRGHRRGKHINN